jgi:hypothetical protein
MKKSFHLLYFFSNLLNRALWKHIASGLMYKIWKHSIKTWEAFS